MSIKHLLLKQFEILHLHKNQNIFNTHLKFPQCIKLIYLECFNVCLVFKGHINKNIYNKNFLKKQCTQACLVFIVQIKVKKYHEEC